MTSDTAFKQPWRCEHNGKNEDPLERATLPCQKREKTARRQLSPRDTFQASPTRTNLSSKTTSNFYPPNNTLPRCISCWLLSGSYEPNPHSPLRGMTIDHTEKKQGGNRVAAHPRSTPPRRRRRPLIYSVPLPGFTATRGTGESKLQRTGRVTKEWSRKMSQRVLHGETNTHSILFAPERPRTIARQPESAVETL